MNHRICTILFLSLANILTLQATPADIAPRLVSVQRIWDAAPHSAFTDLLRYRGKWFCTLRESAAHVGGDGKIRVMTSRNGERWESIALLSEEGIDLRDPKLSVTPNNQLMLVMGGSVYEGKKLIARQPRVAFSKDGQTWTPPRRVLEEGDWLWRVTWHKGRAYGISYTQTKPDSSATNAPAEWTVTLVESNDGIAFRPLTRLEVPGRPNEATVRFLRNGDGVALVRREGPGEDRAAWIGRSRPPYTNWTWHSAGMQIGGPNFLVLPGGPMIASGRHYGNKATGHKTFIGRMTLDRVKPELILPSGGDCSYPGMVWRPGLLWLSYYSSHEGESQIYLAKIRLPALQPQSDSQRGAERLR